jgi:hypothetical protein
LYILDFKAQRDDGGEEVGLRRISCNVLFVPYVHPFTQMFLLVVNQGSKASEIILEGFADKLADSIVKGQSSIGDWSSEGGAKINVSRAYQSPGIRF